MHEHYKHHYYSSGINAKLLSGTTTLAIKCKDGAVLGADTRVTSGYYVAHKTGRKIYMIRPYIAVTIAGLLADAQAIVDILKLNVNLYEIHYGRRISVKAAARLLSYVLHRNRLLPLLTELIVAGRESDKYLIYRLDPLGSLLEDKYAVTGSGSPIAAGIIESEYREDMSLKDGIKLTIKALMAAMKRDAASGDEIMVAVIDENGYRELSKEEINKFIELISTKQ
ncbi:MAG: proteasome subunit beta [Candidatus Geothermarchaeota archaeon]